MTSLIVLSTLFFLVVIGAGLARKKRVSLKEQADQIESKKLEQAFDAWIATYNRRQKEKNKNR